MNILGFEIDCSFIYLIEPIYVKYADDYYLLQFKIVFKDGNSHIVKISFNYSEMDYRNNTYSSKEKTLNKRQLKSMTKKYEKDLEKIKKIRQEIVNAKNINS